MVIPRLHRLDFGEGLSWTPPAGAARFIVWAKTAAADAAPRWLQVAGYDVANDTPIAVTGQSTTLAVASTGVTGDWQTLVGLFDGYDPQVVMVTAQDAQGRPMTMDRYSLPAPKSTDAATIVAQERRLLQKLLFAREAVAETGGHAKIKTPDGSELERVELAALDRRVAEVRARIVWFETAAGGTRCRGPSIGERDRGDPRRPGRLGPDGPRAP